MSVDDLLVLRCGSLTNSNDSALFVYINKLNINLKIKVL